MAGFAFGTPDNYPSPLSSRSSAFSSTEWRYGVSTPPSSNRPSLDSPQATSHLVHPHPTSKTIKKDKSNTLYHASSQSPTPPSSPPKRKLVPSLDSLIAKVKNVADGHLQGARLSGISPELYRGLEEYANVDGNIEGWEGLR